MADIILVRTHVYDHALDRFVYRLLTRTGRRVVVVADERNGAVICPADVEKLRLDPEEAGLFMTPDAGWRCGDYVLYEALRAFPDATAFWLVEPDVRIHSDDLKPFFDGVDGDLDADFLTAWFTVSSPGWAWHATMKPFAKDVYNCMLQLSRFSRRAVAHLLAKRRELGKLFIATGLPWTAWPNDEAFAGATLIEGGFSIATLRQHAPDYHSEGTFSFTRPVSGRWLDGLPADRRIYHPVVSGRKFLQRSEAYLEERAAVAGSARSIAAEFDTAFLALVRAEAGPLACDGFYRQILDAGRVCEERAGQAPPA